MGLDYLRARYYDPEVGRFLGEDPIGGGYAYALNSPANFTDPTGMVPAGTCLTMDNASHVLVPCGSADAEALVGDTWYTNYLSESLNNGVSDQGLLQALFETVFVAPVTTPSDAIAGASFTRAVGGIPPPPAPHTGGRDFCSNTVNPTVCAGELAMFGGSTSCQVVNPNYHGPGCMERPANVPSSNTVLSDIFGRCVGGGYIGGSLVAIEQGVESGFQHLTGREVTASLKTIGRGAIVGCLFSVADYVGGELQ
jgi:hypothetical protein